MEADLETNDVTIRSLLSAIEARHATIQQDFPRRQQQREAATTIAPSLPSPGRSVVPNQQQQQQQQQAPSITTSGRRDPEVYVPANDTTVIVHQGRSDVAKAVLRLGLEKNIYGFIQSAKISARAFTPLLQTILTWGDIRCERPSTKCAFTLGELIQCGVGLVDLRVAHLASSYEDLKRDFSFNPVDLTLSYSLFNLGHLNQFFKVNYTHLIIDFQMGIEDYLIDLKLTLADIATAGISAETAMTWREQVQRACIEFNRTDPTTRSGMDKRTAIMLRPMDANMFMKRVKLCRDSPENWHVFMGMTGAHLIKLGITRAQLMQLWASDYGTIELILDAFNCTGEERAQLLASDRRLRKD